MKRSALTAFLLLAAAVPAAAQDFGSRWADRVVKELYAERGPLEPQLQYDASAGVTVYRDSNVFLDSDNEQDDVVIVPFAGARLSYTEPTLDAAAELLVNYQAYNDLDDANGDEERFYGKLRYVGTEMSAGLVAIVRHETDPVGALLFDRAERIVADVIPQITFDLTPVFAVEVSGLVQVVRFQEDAFATGQDNENFAGKLALVYTMENSIALVVEGGFFAISYTGDLDALGDMLSPPDADGWFAHGGIRGDLLPHLSVSALVGATGAQSDDFVGTTAAPGTDDTTGSAAIVAQYTGMERFEFTASFHRTIGFGGGIDPYQVVNRFLLLADFQATEIITFGGRAQVEHTSSALDVQRDYVSLGAFATLKAHEYVMFDGGLTYRTGDTSGNVAASEDYDGFIVYLGIALVY